jgi:hypothetical protein
MAIIRAVRLGSLGFMFEVSAHPSLIARVSEVAAVRTQSNSAGQTDQNVMSLGGNGEIGVEIHRQIPKP